MKRTFRKDHHHKNRTTKELEKLMVEFSLQNPHLGQTRIYAQLKVNYEVELSPAGVRFVWLREKMNTSALRVQRSQLRLKSA